jgi:hypothetical protein
VSDAGLYLGVTLLAWGLFLFGYFGGDAFKYLSEQASVLSRLDYARPFPALGARGSFGAFNTWLWPELPWLGSVLFVAWAVVRVRRTRGDPARFSSVAETDHVVVGLFAGFTLHSFVLYPRADESYLLAATLPAVLVVFVVLERLEQALVPKFSWAPHAARALSGALVFAALPLVSLPSADDYRFNGADWGSPRLRRLRYHPADYPTRLAGRPLAEWDRSADLTARRIDALTTDGEAVLVLGKSQLLNFASNTEPVGGRYGHLFYLLRNGVLSRSAFLELVPRDVLRKLYAEPPRVLVEELGDRRLLELLPELQTALGRSRYELAGKWSVFRVYQLRDGAAPGTAQATLPEKPAPQ